MLATIEPDAIRVVISRLEPDCVLLDGQSPGTDSHGSRAAWMSSRSRQVPVIMFTVDAQAQREGRKPSASGAFLRASTR